MSAVALGISSAYAAGLAGSWSYIHGDKATAVFAGAAVGIALVIAAVIGYRQAVTLWLLVPSVVLFAGFIVTLQPPPSASTTPPSSPRSSASNTNSANRC